MGIYKQCCSDFAQSNAHDIYAFTTPYRRLAASVISGSTTRSRKEDSVQRGESAYRTESTEQSTEVLSSELDG